MSRWPVGCWRWIQSEIASLVGHRPRRRMRARLDCAVAAEVEELESRALLTVTFHGGAILPHVELQNIYLGVDWTTNPTLMAQQTKLNQFASLIVQSPYMDMMTNAGYNVMRGSATTGVVDPLLINKAVGITDGQIQSEIQAEINAGKVQAPDANRLYMVYVEPGVAIHTSFGNSITDFLGYHGGFNGTTATHTAFVLHYGVIAYPGA